MSEPRLKWVPWTLAGVAILVAAGLAFLLLHFPFRREKITQALQDMSGGEVRIEKFTRVYFPSPGCVAEGVTIRGKLVSIRKLTIESSYLKLFQRLDRVQADGLVIRIPADRQNLLKPSSSKQSKRVITKFVADGAVLEIESRDPAGQPVRFEVPELRMGPLGSGHPFSYQTSLRLPKPPGEVRSSGNVGPWNSGESGSTPVSGTYSLKNADLGVFNGIEGSLASDGTFHGPLRHIDVDGTSLMPNFALRRSEHPIRLSSRFHAVVNGTDGDTTFERAAVKFQRTDIAAHGEVAGIAGTPGKTVAVDMTVADGRIQDLLRFFLKSPKAPMTGAISLHARAIVPPRDEKFLKKLQLVGDFGVGGAVFTKPQTQGKIDVLSERARGEKDEGDAESVISNLKGHVVLRDGIAQLSNVSFNVPGAVARLQGSYGLLSEAVNLHGTLTMEATVSEANKGVKSFLLKAVNPFFKKKGSNAGAVVPIKITGTYSHPSFGLALGEKR